MPTQRIAVRIPRNQTDPDAQAFITAAGITDTTQQSAINTLVTNLKAYGIWTKMKALYPMVGGTATTHKFNLKDPRDLDIAFRLQFNGGWTHSANGALPNGTNAFANTNLNINTIMSLNSMAFGVYSRTNTAGGNKGHGAEQPFSIILEKNASNNALTYINDNGFTGVSLANTDSRGFFQASRTASNALRIVKNTTHATSTAVTNFKPNLNFYFGAVAAPGTYLRLNDRQIAFGYIADGFTQTECDNLYTAVQAFQTTLGRSIGTQTVSDADAQAFINAAQITDQVQATAINNLVVGLKVDSIWTKMKALYPMVGGTSTTHKFNLKDPRDLDAAFRLQFSGGWTHSANGALPNGTNAFANPYFTPSINGTGLNNLHIGYYSRTNNTSLGAEIGIYGPPYTLFFTRWNNKAYFGINGTYPEVSNTDSSGLFVASRINSTTATLYRNNNTLIAAASNSTSAPVHVLSIGAVTNVGGTGKEYFSDRQCAFSSIGDGLTDAEAANFYTRVQAFQTTLGRQV